MLFVSGRQNEKKTDILQFLQTIRWNPGDVAKRRELSVAGCDALRQLVCKAPSSGLKQAT